MAVCFRSLQAYIIADGTYGYNYISNGIYYEAVTSGDYMLAVCSEYVRTADEFPTDSYVGDIVIPAEIEIETGVTGNIREIKRCAFANCGITSVFIEYRETYPDYWDEFNFKIGWGAFLNCTKLEEITICCEVKSIEKDAFDGCSNLQSLKINSPEPPEVDGDFDFMVSRQCVLYVPVGSKERYEKVPYWKRFQNIEEYDFSELVKINSSNQNVSQSK